MKSFIQVSLVLIGLSSAFFGCGAQTGTLANSGTQCGAGSAYVNPYGCLSQNGCPAGYGFYNGQCLPASQQPGTIPQTTYPQTYPQTNYTCTAGQVTTAYGCLSQGNCPAGYGLYSSFYGNQCVPGNSTTTTNSASCQGRCMSGQVYTQYGCAPQGNCGSCMGSIGGGCYQGYPAY